MDLLSLFLPLQYRFRVLKTFKQSSGLCSWGGLQTFPFVVIRVVQYSQKDIPVIFKHNEFKEAVE